ncbi:MAG: polysaccharide deacetylase family protein [Polyangiaceae bacterium]|nr:polysaccharide deacetylase family protein [Polyangiaceae bacterium]
MLERHFAFYSERFQCLDEVGLLRFLTGGLSLRRTGIVVSFDDGIRDNAEVAAPLLERFRLVGWFMVPGGYIDSPLAAQPRFYRQRIRAVPDAEHPADGSGHAMTWPDVRSLADRGHVVACHTWSHRTLGVDVSAADVDDEVLVARDRLAAAIGRPVRTFSWVRGFPGDYSALAHNAVCRGYDLAFMTMSSAIHRTSDPHVLHRFNVEASFPLPVLRFQISRLNEAAFARRRRSVERAIRG